MPGGKRPLLFRRQHVRAGDEEGRTSEIEAFLAPAGAQDAFDVRLFHESEACDDAREIRGDAFKVDAVGGVGIGSLFVDQGHEDHVLVQELSA